MPPSICGCAPRPAAPSSSAGGSTSFRGSLTWRGSSSAPAWASTSSPPSGRRPSCATSGVRALVQRVSRASIDVAGERVAEIGSGLLVLLGVTHDDTEAEAQWLANKVRALRIFPDADGRMNEPLGEREILCVSQFTLYGYRRKGNRPSYVAAAAR